MGKPALATLLLCGCFTFSGNGGGDQGAGGVDFAGLAPPDAAGGVDFARAVDAAGDFAGCPAGFADCNGNPADGCEANLATDGANCGGCGKACPMGQSCTAGACKGGAQVCHGVNPPAQCQQGNDPESGDRWVTCFADCSTAWISHSEANGPQYGAHFHALQICQALGYATVAKWGCSYECAWCQDNPASCNNPGGEVFDHPGVDQACMNDGNGPVLCGNVMWLCSI